MSVEWPSRVRASVPAMQDCVVNGQTYRAGSAIGGKALDIEWLREQFDECCRLEGLGQTLQPYVKSDKRSGLDAAARRVGKRTNNDICKDAAQGAIWSGARTLQEFEYELGARGVDLRGRPEGRAQGGGQARRADLARLPARWREGLDPRHVHGPGALRLRRRHGWSRGPIEPRSPHRQPAAWPPKPLPVPTTEQLEESATVVDELAAKGRARGYGRVPAPAAPKKPAKPIMLSYFDPVRREGATPDTFGMRLDGYIQQEIDEAVAYWEWEQEQEQDTTAQPAEQAEPTAVEPVEASSVTDVPAETEHVQPAAAVVVLDDMDHVPPSDRAGARGR